MALRRFAVLSTLLAATLVTMPAASAGATAAPAASRVVTAANAPTTGYRFVDVPARDGVVLKANWIAPATPGKHPAIVFVSSWSLNDAEYLVQARILAQRGYVVLSYTPRGWWASGGQIDTAGPKDMADMSAAIDWLVANTAADPAHIGAAGCSYGAGISLLAAAFEPRIKAVVAMSAWTDLVRSLYGNDTRRPQAVWLLKIAAQLFGRPSPELTHALDAYFANDDIDDVIQWGRVRSAATYVDRINRNHPAILMANSYGDSLFAPSQLVDFFGRLTGPKRLELAPGDHIVVEATGLAGLPNHVWTSAYRWFDQYLGGESTGIDNEPPCVLRRLDSDAVEGYADWAHVTSSSRHFNIGDVRWWDGSGPLSDGAVDPNWSQPIWTGMDTTAGAGVALLTNGWTALTGIPPTVWLPTVNRINGAVWISDPLGGVAAIRGRPRLHLSVSPSQPQGTVVAYLYDTDWSGTGRLITHAPATWLAPTDKIDLAFEPTAYDLPAGHGLALVIDTADPLYFDANPNGVKISFTGASWFDVPLR
jgi:putative CocE/NonD family hydrolase